MSLTLNTMRRSEDEKIAMFNRNLAAQVAYEARNPLIQSYYAIVNVESDSNALNQPMPLILDTFQRAGLDEGSALTLYNLLKSELTPLQWQSVVMGNYGLSFKAIGEIAALNALSDYDVIVDYVQTELEKGAAHGQSARAAAPGGYAVDTGSMDGAARRNAREAAAAVPTDDYQGEPGEARGEGFRGRGFAAKGLLAKEQVRAGNDNIRYKIPRVAKLL